VADSRRPGVSNVFDDEWEEIYPRTEGWRANMRRLAPGSTLGMTVIELPPGQTQCPYHFHHGNEEVLLVLRGSPTLRTPEGERQLEAGDFVHFPNGPDGAHQVFNRTDEPARYVLADAKVSPEIVQYPDSGKIASMSRETQLWSINRLDAAVDYFDGEQPRA
jgi:uncharacterized cupin superfamily protein